MFFSTMFRNIVLSDNYALIIHEQKTKVKFFTKLLPHYQILNLLYQILQMN